MVPVDFPENSSPELLRAEIVRWAAGLGAVTAESLAVRLQVGVGSARARLLAAERSGLLARHRPLAGQPALYTVTRAGLRAVAVRRLDPARVSAAGAGHLVQCARIAAILEHRYPDHRVAGERELRRDEREQGRVLASAELGVNRDGQTLRHRPDLVLWPVDPHAGAPVAIEIELTVKAPERLAHICQAWARARCVAGVVYLAAPDVERALLRALDRVHAHERVVVVPLDALSREHPVPSAT
jgi:hypothetical protein